MQMIPFDKRDGFIWINGSFEEWNEAKVHVLNHGLHYGSCVFEGIITVSYTHLTLPTTYWV